MRRIPITILGIITLSISSLAGPVRYSFDLAPGPWASPGFPPMTVAFVVPELISVPPGEALFFEIEAVEVRYNEAVSAILTHGVAGYSDGIGAPVAPCLALGTESLSFRTDCRFGVGSRTGELSAFFYSYLGDFPGLGSSRERASLLFVGSNPGGLFGGYFAFMDGILTVSEVPEPTTALSVGVVLLLSAKLGSKKSRGS